jgi:hypothetical protein
MRLLRALAGGGKVEGYCDSITEICCAGHLEWQRGNFDFSKTDDKDLTQAARKKIRVYVSQERVLLNNALLA